jgi:hypothetical protein
MLRLQDFTGANGVRGRRHRAADFRRWKIRRQLQRLREEAIAEQHRDFIAPIRRERGPAAPDFGFVYHVVVNERGQMHQFDDDRRRHVRVGHFAERPGGQRHQHGTQMLAAPLQRVFGVRHDLRIELVHLPEELFRHCVQKRLHRFHEALPGTIQIGIRRARYRFGRHL